MKAASALAVFAVFLAAATGCRGRGKTAAQPSTPATPAAVATRGSQVYRPLPTPPPPALRPGYPTPRRPLPD